MRIGSVSKPFVATAAMQLVEQGALDLHADVAQYLQGFRFRDGFAAPVALAHLLTHTAGLGDHWSSYRHTVQKIAVLGAETAVYARGERLLLRESEYLPIGPLLYQEAGGQRRIASREDERGRITRMFWGPYAYERLAWYDSPALHRALLDSTGWVWGGIAALGPPVALLRRRCGSLAGRFYYTYASLAAGLFAWFLNYWYLLGFHLG